MLSTRPPGATRHVPISRNVTAVVATSRSTRRPQRKKEPLGWHECAMIVCYTRIAHNLTQATVCCGESAGQFTGVGARVLISMPRDLRIAWARTKRFMCTVPLAMPTNDVVGFSPWWRPRITASLGGNTTGYRNVVTTNCCEELFVTHGKELEIGLYADPALISLLDRATKYSSRAMCARYGMTLRAVFGDQLI